ncbi:MAG TPA: hypothetical protein VM307_11040 [Egibacteraceae bacterium]|nr:hypothetical protein [Egibacteraceae bacterium]
MSTTARAGLLGALAGLVIVIGLAATGARSDPAPPRQTATPADAPATPADDHHHRPAPQQTEARRRPPRPVATAADRLVSRTRRHAGRYGDVATATAAGYRSIGDAITGYEHYVHPARTASARILDPRRPESLVYRVEGSRRRLVSVMYILPPGSTMADVPDLGDQRAAWHLHEDLCWDDDGRVAGLLVDGRCVPSGRHVVTPPMLHVWLIDHPCGPFAGLNGHGDACRHEHD